ncbi:MAG: hypothetical protein JWM56_84 [Candidatus Peribacteria bacterium]|nr:hypothetical protein [Candidatus Peribacteria bacterium]
MPFEKNILDLTPEKVESIRLLLNEIHNPESQVAKDLEVIRKREEEKMKPYLDAIHASTRLTAEDMNTYIGPLPDDL